MLVISPVVQSKRSNSGKKILPISTPPQKTHTPSVTPTHLYHSRHEGAPEELVLGVVKGHSIDARPLAGRNSVQIDRVEIVHVHEGLDTISPRHQNELGPL